MISRRMMISALGFLTLTGVPSLAAAAAETPAADVSGFYDVLLKVMKDGSKLGFAGRRAKLAPALEHAFDLPLMTRLMVGPQWSTLKADDQQNLVDAFVNFSVATYANRFDDFSGERFEVDPTATEAGNGDVIVHSKLIKSDGGSVALDYLLRQDAKGWRIVDVYLSGTVSELATRRSEFSSVLRRGGAGALVNLLQQKAAELSS